MKIFIYTEILKIEKQIEEQERLTKQKQSIEEEINKINEQVKIRNTIIIGILKGILLEKQNNNFNQQELELIKLSGIKIENKSSVTQNKGDTEQMKLQNITIHKNKTCNTWYTRFRNNGKQIYISAKTQKDCYNKLKEKLNILKKEKSPKYFTFQSWYEKWLELFKIKKVKESTLSDYKFMLKNINEKLLKKDISKITKIELIEQINNIKGQRQREKTFVFLKDIFTKAFNYNVIKENIFTILEKPKHIKKCGSAMNEEEQQTFIQNCLKNNETIFLITLYQGLRRGECLALTNEDFDIENKSLTINKSQNDKNKISTTKNEYSNRKVPLFNNTLNLLEKTKLLNIKGKLFNYTTHSIQDSFKKILKACNFNRDFRIHDLRHTFITNCKNQNIPEHIIQSWVGHNIGSNVTSKVYTHITSDKKEIEILNKFYSNSTQKKESQ